MIGSVTHEKTIVLFTLLLRRIIFQPPQLLQRPIRLRLTQQQQQQRWKLQPEKFRQPQRQEQRLPQPKML